MPISDCEVRDPRIKRTRQLLQGALRKLLQEKGLDDIMVQDITEAATVNRATFYDHYADKFALFDAMIASDVHHFLESRNVRLDGTCPSALQGLVLAVCEYLKQTRGNPDCARHRSSTVRMDAAITFAIRRIMLEGLKNQKVEFSLPREILASAVSSAIFGAAKEWAESSSKPAEEVAPFLVRLVLPLLEQSRVTGREKQSDKKQLKSSTR
jgi:AcrR family transcriptional regulator